MMGEQYLKYRMGEMSESAFRKAAEENAQSKISLQKQRTDIYRNRLGKTVFITVDRRFFKPGRRLKKNILADNGIVGMLFYRPINL